METNTLSFKHKLIGIFFGLLALFSFYMFAVSGGNAKAQELANWKVQEVTAEVQIGQWTAAKTQATANILRLNGELAKEAQTQGKRQATSK